MINEERVFRLLLNSAGNPLTVLRPKHERPQNQEIERPLEQREPLLFCFLGRRATTVFVRLGRMSTQAPLIEARRRSY